MSNLIKGYQTSTTQPFIIDANQHELVKKLDEQAKMQQNRTSKEREPDEDGFVMGLETEEVKIEEDIRYADYVKDVEAAHEAALVFNEAYDEAKRILAESNAQAASIKEQAHAEGVEIGKQEGRQIAQEELEQTKQQLYHEQEEYKAQLAKEQEETYAQLEPRFNNVICDLLERLTGVIVKEQEDIIMYLINNAMQELDNAHCFVIYLSEEDYLYVDKHKEEIYGYLNPNVKVELFQDNKLQQNQCKIETENGLADISLDVQLSQMKEALMMLNA